MSQQQAVIKVALVYADAIGIRTMVIDGDGRLLNQASDETSYGFCRLIQKKAGQKLKCQQIHLYGSYQAKKLGKAYVFSCPYGLVHWVSPVLNEGRIQYSLIAGPVLTRKAEVVFDEITRKQKLSTIEVTKLQAELNLIPYIEPSQVDNMATLLMISTFYLSNNSDLSEKHDYHSRQVLFEEVIREIKQDRKVMGVYSADKEIELLSKIRMDDQDSTHEILNKIIQNIFLESDNDIESVRSRVLDLMVQLFQVVQKSEVDEFIIFGKNYQYLRELAILKNVSEIAYWLSLVLARFNECVFKLKSVKNVDIISKVVNYLWEHYMEDITLEKLAKKIYLSPSYLSKLFKEEMKSNFRNYLNVLRVENSKKLLLDATIPLAAVAGMVGFPDQSYYTKVFKKITKMSPNEFRKARGNLIIGLFQNSMFFSGRDIDFINKANLAADGTAPVTIATPLNIAIFVAPGATSEKCIKATMDIFNAHGVIVKTITATEINEAGGLNNLDVIILPGGGGTAEANALGENGCAAVKQFVKNGGGYIGTHAGSFLAAVGYNTSTSWLDLVNAEIIDLKHWERGEGEPRVKITNHNHPILKGFSETFIASYTNGPLFKPGNKPDLPPYQELGVYVDDICDSGGASPGIMPGTSAIITSTYGSGRCVLFSFDPELTSGLEGMLIQAARWVKGLE